RANLLILPSAGYSIGEISAASRLARRRSPGRTGHAGNTRRTAAATILSLKYFPAAIESTSQLDDGAGGWLMVRKVGIAALAACTISALATTIGWSADKPVFGLVMSFSGWFAPIDADTIAGAKLAVAEINAAGGVLGQPIEVVEFDNKSEPPLGADGAVDVIGKGAKAILFPSDFDFGAPGAYVAQQKDVIAFSGASDPKFGVQGVGPLAYSTSNASQAQGALLAEWAFKEKGWKTAYVLLDNTIAYTKSLCASMGTRWKEVAGADALLGEDTFLNGDASIAAQVTRITSLA